MASQLITGTFLALLGLLVGLGVSGFSRALAQKRFRLRSRRTLWLVTACAAIGMMSGLWAGHLQLPVLAAVMTALLGWQLLLIGVVDAENFWLPDILTVPLGLSGLLASIILPYPLVQGWIFALISGAVGFIALWLIAFLYSKIRGQSGLGGGDPILFGMGAIWVGLSDLVLVTLIAAITGLLMALVFKVAGRRIGLTSQLPFGTYLAIGFGVCWLLT